jgi:hypothetical protein
LIAIAEPSISREAPTTNSDNRTTPSLPASGLLLDGGQIEIVLGRPAGADDDGVALPIQASEEHAHLRGTRRNVREPIITGRVGERFQRHAFDRDPRLANVFAISHVEYAALDHASFGAPGRRGGGIDALVRDGNRAGFCVCSGVIDGTGKEAANDRQGEALAGAEEHPGCCGSHGGKDSFFCGWRSRCDIGQARWQ